MTERALPVTILEPAGIDPELLDHSLSLRFDLGQFDPRITFTRNSSATYFGSDGLLKTASANEPRIDYDPVTGECKGFLVEETRTNLLTYSEQFDNAAWNKNQSTLTPDAITAPDGTLTADKLVENSSAASHYLARQTSVTSGTTYTESWFVKAGGRSSFSIACVLTTTAYAGYDLTTGTVTTQGGAGYLNSGIQSIGNGWFRVHLTFVAQATENLSIQRRIIKTSGMSFENYTGDATSGIYIWGAQLEAGAFPTSYIKTEASQVTRSADAASMTGTNFSSWYSPNAGVFAGEFQTIWDGNAPGTRVILSMDSSTNKRVAVINNTSNVVRIHSVDDSSIGAAASNVDATGVPVKFATAYSETEFAACAAGASVGSITGSTSNFRNSSSLNIGRFSGGNILCGHIRKIAYYPKRLPNAKLQALTA